MSSPAYPQLFTRFSQNPILSAEQWPYPVHSVFNAGATLLGDGTTLLLCRVEDRSGISHLCAARSADGITDWRIDPQPTFQNQPEAYPEELWGVEDPRITYIPELEQYLVAYTAFGEAGPGVALASTQDFVTFERMGLIMQASDKDAALFPCQFDGLFMLLHRPSTPDGSHIWISESPDLTNWGGHRIILHARRGAYWDANKIGLSPPPIRTEEGWLILYHGVRTHASGSIYRLGAALLDLEQPDRCIRRGHEWLMGPEAPYELIGDVGSVVFPCGTTLLADGDTLRVYYGAADSCIGLATASVREILTWLRDQPSTHPDPISG